MIQMDPWMPDVTSISGRNASILKWSDIACWYACISEAHMRLCLCLCMRAYTSNIYLSIYPYLYEDMDWNQEANAYWWCMFKKYTHICKCVQMYTSSGSLLSFQATFSLCIHIEYLVYDWYINCLHRHIHTHTHTNRYIFLHYISFNLLTFLVTCILHYISLMYYLSRIWICMSSYKRSSTLVWKEIVTCLHLHYYYFH